MGTRPLMLLTAAAAVALVVVGGCEPKVQAKTPNTLRSGAPGRNLPPAPQGADLLLQVITQPLPADTLPAAGFDGLQARVQHATEEAAGAGATLSVAILDRATHQLVSNGNAPIDGIASVAKLFIADELLLQDSSGKPLSPEDRQALDVMLRSSDDDAAERFWDQNGADGIVTQIATRYGLAATGPPGDGRWWNTVSTAADLIHYYEMLLDGSGGLPPERARVIINDLAQSTPTGIDGYPQRFGIPEGLYAEPVAVKQGWMCCIGSDWMHLSTGVIGSDRRYIMVVESLQTTDDATARQTITQAVKTMFPTGRI
ncbi:hypothetical protein [Mycobacterium sp.]|uniref:hypothetical protein n=1 Tax=Mycobacterium sp. TaxID=1785 RepID=UPI002BACEC83|nr:hypothetical protein [Mycobacterium sp.]HTQ22642.1 hypothetical protein [Mycobacterium sp.]